MESSAKHDTNTMTFTTRVNLKPKTIRVKLPNDYFCFRLSIRERARQKAGRIPWQGKERWNYPEFMPRINNEMDK